MKLKYLSFILSCFLLFACGDTSNSTEDKQDTTVNENTDETPTDKDVVKPPVVEDSRPVLYLEGLYATSTANSSNIRNAFDDNPQTKWETIAGAGPDEGIMIYLPEKKYIEQIKINAADLSQYAKILDLNIFANGVPVTIGGVNEVIPIEKELKSLYIRFLRTENENSSQLKRDGNAVTLSYFSKDHQLGIEDIILYGKDKEAYRVVPPRLVKGKIIASSTLAPEVAYGAAQIFDARKEFAWVEGAEHDGKGESIRLELEEKIAVNGLKLWNGYQRSTGHYKKNARVKHFKFGDEASMRSYTLRDSPNGQKFPLGVRLSSDKFILEVEDIYKGAAYKDLAISELLLLDEEESIIVESDFAKNNQAAYRQKAKNTSLENLLDRRIYNLSGKGDFESERSLILRSDGTFVNYAYAYDESQNDETKSISDGNWEILAASPEEVKLKLFGKYFDYSNMEAYYKGEAADEMTRIFKDVVTIKDGVLQGEKFIDVLYLE